MQGASPTGSQRCYSEMRRQGAHSERERTSFLSSAHRAYGGDAVMLIGDFALQFSLHTVLHNLPPRVSPNLALTEKSAAS